MHMPSAGRGEREGGVREHRRRQLRRGRQRGHPVRGCHGHHPRHHARRGDCISCIYFLSNI